jgi:phage terminase large subunit-like protein
LYLLCADGEQGAEVYSGAADKDQARLVFEEAKRMVLSSPELAPPRLQVYKDVIFDPETWSLYRVLSADALTKHGLNPHGVIFDEVHTQKTRELWDVLTTAQGTRTQPLTFAITTAGYDRTSLCFELHTYGQRVRANPSADPSFYSVHYGAADDADWEDRREWRRANPALGSFLSMEFLENEYRQAKELPSRQNAFRQLYLNQWVQQHTRWIDMKRWAANAGVHGRIAEAALKGRRVWGGLDLGSVSDLTALIWVAECADGAVDVFLRCWAPEAVLERDRNPRNYALYQRWREAGYLTTTPGDATDYGAVRAQVLRDREVFDVQSLAYDKAFQAQQISMELADAGVDVLPLGQSAYYQDPQIRTFERLLLEDGVHHGENPILTFAAENAVVRKDGEGRMKLDKQRSQEKVDPLSALLLALDAFERREQPSVYETRGVEVF